MPESEAKVRAAVAAAIEKLTPGADGAYSSDQLASALRAAMRECASELATCQREAAQSDVSCNIAPHWCRYAFLAYEDSRVSAWLLGWPEGNPGAEIHDHGDSCAAVSVVSGTVRETVYTPEGAQAVRHLPAGECVQIPRAYIHKFED